MPEQVTKEMIAKQIDLLYARDAEKGYRAMDILLKASEKTAAVYSYIDEFLVMLDSSNSYVRTRGLALIVANAKWDVESKIDMAMGRILQHISNKKPITARQFIRLLPLLVADKPGFKKQVINALNQADVFLYSESMQHLVEKDIGGALRKIADMGQLD